MALVDTTWYTNFGDGSTTGYYAVTVRPQNTAVAAGILRRQFTAPAVGSERVFVCIVAGTTANVTDATWVLTRGAKTTDGTATWMECTGQASLNGDLTNTATWAQVKAATPAVLGQVIKRSNNASYQICTTAGAMSASEPTFSDTAGVTTTDTTAVWTSLGVVGNFTGGQAPFARLVSACAANWFASGNTVYIADNHAETLASANIIPASTGSAVGRIICHNHSGSYPPGSGNIMTGAVVSNTSVMTLNGSGSLYVYGVAFKAGVGSGSGGSYLVIKTTTFPSWLFFDNCSLQAQPTGAAQIALGDVAGGTYNCFILNNTTVYFGGTGGFVLPAFSQVYWKNTGQVLASGSVVPSVLFGTAGSSGVNDVVLEALDLSQLTGSLFSSGANATLGSLLIKDCKLNASVTVGTPLVSGMTVQLVRCDSAATAYKSARYAYEGTETTETSITRVGGATDPIGQLQSRKIITTANAQWLRPFKAEPYAIWNAVTGANVTVTVCGTINSGSLPNNDDLWLECEYISDSSFPLGKIITTTKSNLLAANAAVASDGSSWNNANPSAMAFDLATATSTALSNGNLTATHTNTTGGVGARCFPAQDRGKYYFEITWVAAHGAADAAGLLDTGCSYANFAVTSVGVYVTVLRGGNVNINIGGSANLLCNIGAFAANDVLGIAVDFNAHLVWCRRNNGNWNASGSADPATGAGGFVISSTVGMQPGIAFAGAGTAINDAFTINFGATTYANAAPSGFGTWVAFTPFKLVATLSSPQPGMAGYVHARVRAAKASTTWYIDPMVTLS